MHRKASLAKISRPRLFDVVPRERLFRLLDANRGRPLIWIASPPGAGKTALVASYVEARGIPAIWYQVDAGDADPAGFFHYLSLAAEQAATGEAALPRFSAEHFSDVRAFSRLYFRALFERLPSGALVVLDNYQELPGEASLHKIVEELVRQTPTDSSVVCISRLEPPLCLAILEANGATCLISWDRLKLTLEEVREISNRHGITDAWILQTVYQQSQGWAAGVTLMLERLRHLDGSAHELPMDSRESVFNYFATLVFNELPDSTRKVLLRVAFLPHVSPRHATVLSGIQDATNLLEGLFRRRLFVDRRAGVEPLYQFHALFQEFLKKRARTDISEHDLHDLLSQSAIMLENSGDLDAAVCLWIGLGKRERAVSLFLKAASDLVHRGRRETLERWLRMLGDEHLDAWLSYWKGCAQLQTDPSQGVRTLEEALNGFRASKDQKGVIVSLGSLLAGVYIGYFGMEAMTGWLDELLSHIEAFPEALSSDERLQIWGVLCCALVYVRPSHQLTVGAPQQVESLLPQCSEPGIALTSAIGAISSCMLTGQLERAERIAIAAGRFAEQDNLSPSESVWWFCQVGYLKFVEADYDEASRYLDKAASVAKLHGLRSALREVLLHRVTVECRTSGWHIASATMDEINAMSRASRPGNESLYWLHHARRARFLGASEEAGESARQAYQVARQSTRLWEMIIGICTADLLIEIGRTQEAPSLLERSKQLIDQAHGYECYRGALTLAQARVAYASGDIAVGRRLLLDGLALSRDGTRRYYLSYLFYGLPWLVTQALEADLETAFVRELIAMLGFKPPGLAPTNWPWPVRIYTMGRFKVEVRGAALEFPRKVPRKTLLLLKALVAYGSTDVPEYALCDALWGDEEADAASNALAISVVRLRKLLGSNETVLQQGGKISLNLDLCWVDAWAFERHLSDASRESKALKLYAGTFLPDEQAEGWSVAARERLRGKFIHALSRQGESLERKEDLQLALECYQRGIDADPIIESFHQGLMRCYERLGRRSEALSVYRRLRQTLSVVLGVPPSESTQHLFRQMLQRQIEEGAATGEREVDEQADSKVRVLPARRTRKR